MLLSYLKLTFVIVAFLMPIGCKKESAAHNSTNEPAFTKPTATELFNLRSKCVELGDKVVADKFAGSDIAQDHSSYYDPKTDHCYIELNENMRDPTRHWEYYSQSLYDGQTGKLLAFATVKNGQKSSLNDLGSWDYDSTLATINSTMAEDKRR